MSKRKIYIAHPFRDDPKGNMEKVAEICRDVKSDYGVTPISPIHAFSFLDPHFDNMDDCLELLSMCDQLWLYGDWKNSRGCSAEFKYAMTHGIAVTCKQGHVVE